MLNKYIVTVGKAGEVKDMTIAARNRLRAKEVAVRWGYKVLVIRKVDE